VAITHKKLKHFQWEVCYYFTCLGVPNYKVFLNNDLFSYPIGTY